jgi:hypothetical protein
LRVPASLTRRVLLLVLCSRADTPYLSALPFYGMPASVDVLEARCADARNACPLNVSGGSEASLLPLPLTSVNVTATMVAVDSVW